jgi:N-acetylneuraminic acid mutarotase
MHSRSFVAASALLLAAVACSDNDSGSPTGPVPTDPSGISEAVVTANTWSTRANMPSDRWYIATATFPDGIGGASLYAIGGSNATGAPLGKVQVYNPATNTWTTKASLPHVVAGYGNNGAQVIGGLVYVPGGMRRWQGYPYLQVYNPATNLWVDKAPMPPIPPYGLSGLAFGVSGAIDGKLYVLGTCQENGAYCGQAFERYDPATNQWSILPLPPVVPQFDRAAGVLNKKFYVTDGKILEAYDPATNTWTLKAPMPSGRSRFTSAAVNNKLYVVGGFYGGSLSGRVDVYDPVTNTWTKKAPIPRLESGLSGGRVVVNGQARLEVVGGARPGNNLQYIP